jgi:engulfment and cell motility protein 1
MARAMYRMKTTFVDPDEEPGHADALEYIWTHTRLSVFTDSEGEPYKWRQLGFATENLGREFGDVGVLGLYCLVCPFTLLSCYARLKKYI